MQESVFQISFSNLFWYFEVPNNVLQIPKSRYATEAEARNYVLNEKMTRDEAYKTAKELHIERQDPSNYILTDEETGEIEYLDSNLDEPEFKKTSQIEAVAKELYEKYNTQ